MTVLSTPPWKTEYDEVLQHRCSSALDFCSVCVGVKGVKRKVRPRSADRTNLGPKAKVISRRQKSPLARKELTKGNKPSLFKSL